MSVLPSTEATRRDFILIAQIFKNLLKNTFIAPKIMTMKQKAPWLLWLGKPDTSMLMYKAFRILKYVAAAQDLVSVYPANDDHEADAICFSIKEERAPAIQKQLQEPPLPSHLEPQAVGFRLAPPPYLSPSLPFLGQELRRPWPL